MASRRLRGQVARSSVYFMALFWPASKNTAKGWRQAVAEAKKQAELAYFREAFGLWIHKENTDKHNLAVFVVIGTKFLLPHVTVHPHLPTMKKGPPDPSTLDLGVGAFYSYPFLFLDIWISVEYGNGDRISNALPPRAFYNASNR
ncbi:hypothetical protein Z517_09213 [Fonsecaea pedrosoi CBS 271.37]|uniref:Uncharacterized protein n=1 Tax=Fonsecaea pedrosoi CBS 271.37 TaxID=1442368 RepID=A0A0D2GWM8_9EURO|nr:uncharacterized protein Z517_09213 [Fonsecaea pedrosoi CBS 271.37]KIW76769.1 hypothetical protein Z517_09213 [Fonsecaea pedrosoi CBS 271.37]